MTHLETLLQQAKAGQLTLLLGLDLAVEATGLPSGQELAHGLAAEYHLPVADSLAAVAQGPKQRGQQWQYASYLKKALPPDGEPGPLHRAVAALPLPLLIATTYDDRLARALAEAGRPANLLLEDRDLEQRRFERPDLIKLCGDVGRPHTLVAAEDEYLDVLLDDNRQAILDRVGEGLHETVLLLGCDPARDGDFDNWLYFEVLRKLGAFGVPGYLVWSQPAAADVARWAGRNVTIIDAEPLEFLNALAQGLEGAPVAQPPDKEMAALRGLLQLLRGSPTRAQVDTAIAQVPATQRLRSIRITFRLRLSAENNLRLALDLAYDPDIEHFSGDFVDSGISLQRLRNWTASAEERRKNWELPQNSPVEQRALEFFEALLPSGSVERQKYERALYVRQRFADALYIVFEPDDERGRLSRVPWELLHDGQVTLGRGFLGLKYPVYRRMPDGAALNRMAGRIQKALLVAADPTQTLGELNAELDWLKTTLEGAGLTVDVRRPDDPDVSDPEAIKRLLRDGGYQLFHFTGHGLFNDDEPTRSKLMLGRARERDIALTAEALAEAARESALVLVFLSACEVGLTDELRSSRPWEEAGVVDALTRAGVPATVGMRWRVGDQNSRKIAQTFYTELLGGKPAERALTFARQAVAGEADWANPILTKRHGVL